MTKARTSCVNMPQRRDSRTGAGKAVTVESALTVCPQRAKSEANVTDAIRFNHMPRVFGIGMSHTGTTTLHKLLVGLGCCYATHNVQLVPRNLRWIWDLAGRTACQKKHNQCMHTMRAEFRRFQCVTDNPWARFWTQLLTHRERPKHFFVLTKAQSPMHYAISRYLFQTRFFRTPRISGAALRARLMAYAWEYERYTAQARAELNTSHVDYIELCWKCGDTVHELARALGSSVHVPPELAGTHANRAPPRDIHESRRLLKMMQVAE
mmetsp:Transcript_22692/g.37505  ORF Transcript_22692/g.37505 Transcript_22692/m.37505 type:complete len:266 (-) Transcript_22692:375-1172(-)|eukprot:CAMPEP_0119335710 /NCGR_PEP_ID=MMETSP1333-20130426/90125_1 /TAXON_ID=418940 /ORGANISM="Scyphosphaera apsteinii, Strain RCC1455" /LENGTH=265 /DNA_ID=CAMNT_0007346329 /DNA_START=199 /DNA_END=996 /DNA_ORIENTATION=+